MSVAQTRRAAKRMQARYGSANTGKTVAEQIELGRIRALKEASRKKKK